MGAKAVPQKINTIIFNSLTEDIHCTSLGSAIFIGPTIYQVRKLIQLFSPTGFAQIPAEMLTARGGGSVSKPLRQR